MDLARERCMGCGVSGRWESTTTTINEQLDGVKVTVEGVTAARCRACEGISLNGKIVIPIYEAIEQILVATGVASRPTPEEEAALRAKNREIARQLGQEDTYVDEPVDEPGGTTSIVKP